MTIPVLDDKVLIRPSDLQPLAPEFKVVGTFNPATARYRDDTTLLVRVAEVPLNQEPDTRLSPRATWNDGDLQWVMDKFTFEGADTRDPRIFRLPDGRVRLRYISHLCLVRLRHEGSDIAEVSCPQDLLPKEPWEEPGIEDPRISQIGDTYYITYVAISRSRGVAAALMTTQDFEQCERHGIIFPTENKTEAVLNQIEPVQRCEAPSPPGQSVNVFNPAVILHQGLFHMHYRAQGTDGVSRIGYAVSEDGVMWKRSSSPVLEPSAEFEPQGLEDPRVTELGGVFYMAYTAYAGGSSFEQAIMPMFARSTNLVDWELEGTAPRVVFSCANLLVEDDVYVYYGAGDHVIGLATGKLEELLEFVRSG